jgi:hypothetical protein
MDIKVQTRQEYIHWSITSCWNRITSLYNNNNNKTRILPQPHPPPPCLHIENFISTSMFDNFKNISNYCNYPQNFIFTYIYPVFNIGSKPAFQFLMFGYTPNLLSSQQVVFNLIYYSCDTLHRYVPFCKLNKRGSYYKWLIPHVFN